jgi:hypothetical protein
VESVKLEGKNSPFSAKLAKLFTNIIQSVNAASTSDNYAFFSMDTVFGPAIVVYDTLRENFVGIDMFENLGVDFDNYPARVKQFAETKTTIGRRFFFITTSNKLFEYYASPVTAICRLYTKEYCSNDPNVELKPTNCYSIFVDSQEEGLVTFQLFVDRILNYTTTESVDKNLTIPTTIIPPPFGLYTQDSVDNVSTSFQQVRQGWKFLVAISWNFTSTLTNVKCIADDVKSMNSLRSQVKAYARNT